MIIPAMAPVEIPGCWTVVEGEGVDAEVVTAACGSAVGIGSVVEVGKESPRRTEVMYVPDWAVTVRVI